MAGIKRNINEMYNNSHISNNMNSSINSNGNNISNLNGINDLNELNGNAVNEAKQSRLDNNNHVKQEPSRVVHLRNIPQQLTENEIIYLGLSFGNNINVLFLRSKNQAF